MWGYVIWSDKLRQSSCRVEKIGKTSLFVLETGRSQRSARRKIRTMYRQGIRRAAVVKNCPWRGMLRDEGILPISVTPLRHALGENIMECWCRENGISLQGKTVQLSAQRCDEVTVRMAQFLAKQARYVSLSVEYGQQRLEKLLWESMGVPVGGSDPIVQVLLGGTKTKGITTLELCDSNNTEIIYELTQHRLPQSIPLTEELVAVLWDCGLNKEEIHVKSVKVTLDEGEKLSYNAM